MSNQPAAFRELHAAGCFVMPNAWDPGSAKFLAGLGFTDIFQNLLYILERPLHGMIYFAVLQTLGRGLLIALDVEENTRRAARK